MKFKNLHPDVMIFGDTSFRGDCPLEAAEQATLINQLRKQYPEIAAITIHVENEGKRTHQQAMKSKAQGLVGGASDIIIPGKPSLVMEIKRQDHTKSKWQEGQPEYLAAAAINGSLACVALGWQSAMKAIEHWLSINKTN